MRIATALVLLQALPVFLVLFLTPAAAVHVPPPPSVVITSGLTDISLVEDGAFLYVSMQVEYNLPDGAHLLVVEIWDPYLGEWEPCYWGADHLIYWPEVPAQGMKNFWHKIPTNSLWAVDIVYGGEPVLIQAAVHKLPPALVCVTYTYIWW